MSSANLILLDADTPAEKFLTILTIVSAGFPLGLLLYKATHDSPVLEVLFYLTLTLTLGLGALRYFLRERYILDFDRRCLFLRRELRGRVSDSTICGFESLKAVLVNGNVNKSKYGELWSYGLSLTTSTGESIEVLTLAENTYADRKGRGTEIAQRLGIEFQDCDPSLVRFEDSPPSCPRGLM